MTDNSAITEAALQKAITEGSQARELFDNPLFQRLLTELDKAYTDAWRREPDAGRREKIHGMVCVLDDLRLNLKQFMDNGTNARARIERTNQIREAEERSGPLA